jgi:hypothetical protein
MTPQHMITVVASAVVIVMATAVLGSVFNSFAATLEIPTYDKTTFPITDPNGTTTIDYPDGAVIISVPYRNGTTSIDVVEYQKCMLNAEKTVEDTANLMGTNIQENSFKFVEDDSMDFCIMFNSENRN